MADKYLPELTRVEYIKHLSRAGKRQETMAKAGGYRDLQHDCGRKGQTEPTAKRW